MNKFITAGKQYSNDIRSIEAIIKHYYSTRSASEPLDMYQQRFEICDNYNEFIKLGQPFLGKPNLG